MGAYLSSPVRDKESEEGENDHYKFGISAMQGWRTDMEDAHAAVLDLEDGNSKAALFAVLDGHGGAEVARFAAKHLAQELVASEGYKLNDVGRALVQTFLHMDELLVKEEHRAELKALRTKEGEGEGEAGGNPMVINGASLPESLLEALGMPSGAGFQIKVMRSGAGAGPAAGVCCCRPGRGWSRGQGWRQHWHSAVCRPASCLLAHRSASVLQQGLGAGASQLTTSRRPRGRARSAAQAPLWSLWRAKTKRGRRMLKQRRMLATRATQR